MQDKESTLVQRRRPGTVKKGSSNVEAEGGQQAPLSIFLSGTSPATTEDIVKEKLKLCAAQVKEDQTELNILRVEHIPLRKIPPGEALRSRCWKVTVAPDWAEHMLTSAAYPGAWGWRRWNTFLCGRFLQVRLLGVGAGRSRWPLTGLSTC